MYTTRKAIHIKRRWLMLAAVLSILSALLACRNLLAPEVAEDSSVPTAPTGLSATLAEGTQTQLTWVDQSADETGFIVRRAGLGPDAAIAEMGRPAVDVDNFLDVTTGCDSAFQYLVQAYNDAGTSDSLCIQTQIVCNEEATEVLISDCGSALQQDASPTATATQQATLTLANTDAPTTAPPTATNTPAPFCGDAICGVNEDAATCAADCPTTCGDGLCTGDEDAASCESDCAPTCGDGLCTHDENASTCNGDCDSVCGDSFCTSGEDAATCGADCDSVCGDNLCTGDETNDTCESDCPAVCGDGICNGDESFLTCDQDCSLVIIPVEYCGDGICNEAPGSCAQDCLGGIPELDPDP